MNSKESSFDNPHTAVQFKAKGTSLLQQSHRPAHPLMPTSLLPGRDARDGITIRKGAMLTTFWVNDIWLNHILGYKRNMESMRSDGKSRRPTSTTKMS